jgi:hypothetical protein
VSDLSFVRLSTFFLPKVQNFRFEDFSLVVDGSTVWDSVSKSSIVCAGAGVDSDTSSSSKGADDAVLESASWLPPDSL